MLDAIIFALLKIEGSPCLFCSVFLLNLSDTVIFAIRAMGNFRRLQFWLKRDGLNAAQNVSKSRPIMEEKYFGACQYKNFGQVRSDIAQYGLEFRNLMNFPLMGAAYCGKKP